MGMEGANSNAALRPQTTTANTADDVGSVSQATPRFTTARTVADARLTTYNSIISASEALHAAGSKLTDPPSNVNRRTKPTTGNNAAQAATSAQSMRHMVNGDVAGTGASAERAAAAPRVESGAADLTAGGADFAERVAGLADSADPRN